MSTDKLIKNLNANRAPAMHTLGGEVLAFDKEPKASHQVDKA